MLWFFCFLAVVSASTLRINGKRAKELGEDIIELGMKEQQIAKGFLKPPRTDGIMNYGYNIFLGKTPEEQRAHLHGNSKLFRYTSGWISSGIYRKYNQLAELSSSAYCEAQTDTTLTGVINGALGLKFQASAVLGQQAQLSDKDDLFSDFVGVFSGFAEQLVSFRGITLYGNTDISLDAHANLEAGYLFSHTKYALQKLYSVSNDFDNIKTWSSSLQADAIRLGMDPTDNDVLNFFMKWGTHGLAKGGFGERCESTIYMSGGADMSTYAAALNDNEINTALSWFQQEGSISTMSDVSGTFGGGLFHYSIRKRMCRGQLMQLSPCAGLMQTFGFDKPYLLDWTYRALWNMDIPRLQQGAKNRMREVAFNIQAAGEECAFFHCNGNGACAPDLTSWENIGMFDGPTQYSQFWDSTRCFCYEGYLGNYCEDGYAAMSYPFSYYFEGCPDGSEVSKFNCESAAKLVGGEGKLQVIENNRLGLPYGCSIDPQTKEIFYNTGKTGWAYSTTQPVCKKVRI